MPFCEPGQIAHVYERRQQGREQLYLRDGVERVGVQEGGPAFGRVGEHDGDSEASDKAFDLIAELERALEDKGAEGEESLETMHQLENENSFQRLIELILLDVQKTGLDGVRKWFSTVGGFRETGSANSVSILSGESRFISTWHYSMSDSVLNTLMYLCFLDENGSVIERPEIALSDVLSKLRNRYGILINEPPYGFDSPEHHAAADENFSAFKARIKQLGWFAGLSDDFDAQYISRPSGDKK